ncbi:hypothetical protein IscW_ISCW015723, partial [Ixodes scapularis]
PFGPDGAWCATPRTSRPPGSHAGGCAVPDEGTRGRHPSRRRHLVEPPTGRRQSPTRPHRHHSRKRASLT